MAIPNGKRRLNLTISEAVDERLQRLADAYGVPKASLCTMMLAQTSMASEQVLNSTPEVVGTVLREQVTKACKEDAAD